MQNSGVAPGAVCQSTSDRVRRQPPAMLYRRSGRQSHPQVQYSADRHRGPRRWRHCTPTVRSRQTAGCSPAPANFAASPSHAGMQVMRRRPSAENGDWSWSMTATISVPEKYDQPAGRRTPRRRQPPQPASSARNSPPPPSATPHCIFDRDKRHLASCRTPTRPRRPQQRYSQTGNQTPT